MKIFAVIGLEWKRIWRNKLTRAGLFAGLVLPLFYSSLYLWANWDPYGNLDKLPVALVNLDQGGVDGGKRVNYGRDLSQHLQEDHSLDWHIVSKADAMQGLSGDKYYMVLSIPPSFTKDVLSVNTSSPRPTHLDFIPNQGKNYLAGQIVKRVQGEIAANVNQEFSQKFISGMLAVLGKEQNGLSTIAETAKKLSNGADSVNQGAQALNQGMTPLSDGASKLAAAMTRLDTGAGSLVSGIAQAQQGTQRLEAGVQQANQGVSLIRQQIQPAAGPTSQLAQGMSQAADGSKQLHQASAQLTEGIGQAVNGANSVASGAAGAASSAKQIQSGLQAATNLLAAYQQSAGQNADANVVQALQILKQLSPGSDNLVNGLGQIEQGSNQLAASLGQIQSGSQKVTDGLGTLSNELSTAAQGTANLSQNMGKLDNGLSQIQSGLGRAKGGLDALNKGQLRLLQGASALQTGIAQTKQGSEALDEGLHRAANGSRALSMGASKLADGASTFASRLESASTYGKMPSPEKLSDIMSHPVRDDTTILNPVAKYGVGLAPYFIPLSLWVGALMLFFLMALREGRWRIAPVSNRTVMLGKFALLWIFGAAQAVVASTVMLCALGLHVENVLGFYGYNIALSVTDVTLIGMFIFILGSGPGRFVAIALLILQLTSSAGTFPIELVPSFFQFLHPILPMSYAVLGLRNLTAIGDYSAVWHTAFVLLGYLAFALLVVMLTVPRRLRASELKRADQLVS